MSIRVFAPPPLAGGQRVELHPDEAHYLLRVRRARPGDIVEVMDGVDAIFRATVVLPASAATRGARGGRASAAAVELVEQIAIDPPAPVSVGIGMPEPKAMLEALTLLCEAGAHEIVMLGCERSQGAMPSNERIERVVRAAMRQCGRPTPPRVSGAVPLQTWLAQPEERPAFVASVPARHGGARAPIDAPAGARLLVGPEGGLTEAEEQAAVDHGFAPIGLGPWVLRTPHAALAGVVRILEG